jgi:autophagy-related protein 2
MVQKLVSLLHLKLPPEIHLSKARASLLRVTFVLDFGVPQIIIEVDGVQIHARLTEDVDSAVPNTRKDSPRPAQSRTRPRSPHHQRRRRRRRESSPSPPTEDDSGASSDTDDEHLPTVDDLAQSFLREEPGEEIRQLEEALNSQSEYLQESVSSNDDGDEESTGMGAPLALPAYLRNIMNTALDRLQIIASNIDIIVDDQFPVETSTAASEIEGSFASLNFHVERIAIDSVTAQEPRVDVTSTRAEDAISKLGKRRMRVENICARLISDADNFASMSRVSRPSSQADTRSEVSFSQKSRSEPSASQVFTKRESANISPPVEDHVSNQGSIPDLREETIQHHSGEGRLESSILTTDEDRFADAAFNDELDHSTMNDSSTQSRQFPPPQAMSASSFLYDDEGLLDYAMEANLFDSTLNDPSNTQTAVQQPDNWEIDGVSSSRRSHHSPLVSEASTSGLLTASALAKSVDSLYDDPPLEYSVSSEQLASSTDNLDAAIYHALEEQDSPARSTHIPSPPSPPEQEDLIESKLFTHEDAESMYMSAMSAAPLEASHRPAIPGGWDSASSSSQDTSSDTSAPLVPESMIAGSILVPVPEADDGYDTPRPGSPQSVFSSPQGQRKANFPKNARSEPGELQPRVAKQFLNVDELTVWFPLGLDEGQTNVESAGPTSEESGLDFRPPNLGEDSIFQEMPGSFSNYAHSKSVRRNRSLDVPEHIQKRPTLNTPRTEQAPTVSKQGSSATVSVEVGSVVGHIDFSTGRIIFQMVNRLLKALTGEPELEHKHPKTQESPSRVDTHTSIDLYVKRVNIAWLERLMAESIITENNAREALDLNPLDAIVKIKLSSIQAASQSGAQGPRAKLQIGKFTLSSLDQDVISFHTPKTKSRLSITRLPEQLNNDIEIDFEQGKDRRITIVTRPVKVVFDLQKLDDALSSFGGFSGILELGSSITSNNTVSSPMVSPSPLRPRGVHFGDHPPPPPPLAGAFVMPKIHIQFGDVSFTLKGKSCAVQLQTTSVRLAVRLGGLRLKVSEVMLSGPYVDASQLGAPLMVEIRDTTVNFLLTPEEVDLSRLISMITPSKDPYENDEDILIETLLRQRRKGSVVRAEVASVGIRVSDIAQLQAFEALGAEIARLSKVTKYLPDDDRPGLLTLAAIQQFNASFVVNERLGDVSVSLRKSSLAHVGVPALFAVEVGEAFITRGKEVLIHEVVKLRPQDQLPMIMVRMVGDEMEPVIKAKLFNLCVEYHVSTVMAALGISEDGTLDDIAHGLTSSVATITGASSPKSLSRQSSESETPPAATAKPFHIDLLLRSCAIGLNPCKIVSKALFVLTDAHFAGKQIKKDELSVVVELRKASIHAIDDIARLEEEREPSSAPTASWENRHLIELRESGYVSLSSISAAKILVHVVGDGKDQPQEIDVEFHNELFVIESCADSTQTLISILNGLQPPTPPSSAERYRTVVPLQTMMESFSGDAMIAPQNIGDENFEDDADFVADEVPSNLEFVGSFYNPESLPSEEDLGDSMLGEDDLGVLAPAPVTRQRGERVLLESFQEQYEVTEGEEDFDFDEGYFKDSDSDRKGHARKWNSTKNQYQLSNEFKVANAPLKVRVRDMNIIWNLFDGYDWPKTRGVIAQAVEDVEARAEERRRKPRDEEDDEDFVEEDFLFNSVWIGVPIKDEKGALAKRINNDIDDLVSETGSYATSTATRSTGATVRPRSANKSRRRLKLERSKHRKIAFQINGVAVDLVLFPPNSGETQNSVNVRLQEFEIYDHIPSSTWRKFVTSLIPPSQREMGKPMINLELLTVKPITELAASELVIRVTVLPLRLHVDQDALDFITRFFEFKDDSAPEVSAPSEQPFIQRLEVMAVTLKLDYKPKRVDYRGIRSGHTTEFMNFLILDGADIVLRHAIVYGITSFDKLNKTLNDVWMPDVKRNQLPFVLSGLAAVRPLVNVGSGLRDLVVVPMREYKKDGRIVRSLQKGAYAFAKNTTSEVARLGAKVAIGTQNLLEGAENFLAPSSSTSPGRSSLSHDWDDVSPQESSDEEPRATSNYANQPIGVRAGLRTAARHLERDLLTARDAIIAIPTEVMEEGTGIGMVKAIGRRAPTVILRPALGATKAVSNALLGVGNALDEGSRRKIDDVSCDSLTMLRIILTMS